MHAAGSIEINRSIDDVFILTTEHVAQWSIIVVEDEVIEEKPGDVGTTFRTVTEEDGKRMEFQGIITRSERPHVHAIHLTGEMFDIDTEYTFEDLGGRTRVTQGAKVTGKGLVRVIMLLFGWLMNRSHCKATDRELLSLKKFCEEYPGHPSD